MQEESEAFTAAHQALTLSTLEKIEVEIARLEEVMAHWWRVLQHVRHVLQHVRHVLLVSRWVLQLSNLCMGYSGEARNDEGAGARGSWVASSGVGRDALQRGGQAVFPTLLRGALH